MTLLYTLSAFSGSFISAMQPPSVIPTKEESRHLTNRFLAALLLPVIPTKEESQHLINRSLTAFGMTVIISRSLAALGMTALCGMTALLLVMLTKEASASFSVMPRNEASAHLMTRFLAAFILPVIPTKEESQHSIGRSLTAFGMTALFGMTVIINRFLAALGMTASSIFNSSFITHNSSFIIHNSTV